MGTETGAMQTDSCTLCFSCKLSIQAGQVQSKRSELLGFAESEQVFKGRKCPQLSCALPGLAIWALSHLFLPPTRLFKLWDVFQPSEYPTLPFYR